MKVKHLFIGRFNGYLDLPVPVISDIDRTHSPGGNYILYIVMVQDNIPLFPHSCIPLDRFLGQGRGVLEGSMASSGTRSSVFGSFS